MGIKTRIQKIEKRTGVRNNNIELNEATKALLKKLGCRSDKEYTPEEFRKMVLNQDDGLKVWQR